MDSDRLLAEREATHGQAWVVTSKILTLLYANGLLRQLFVTDYVFAWTMILNKLIRALYTPNYEDHWRDMIGYIQLVLGDLEGRGEVRSDSADEQPIATRQPARN